MRHPPREMHVGKFKIFRILIRHIVSRLQIAVFRATSHTVVIDCWPTCKSQALWIGVGPVAAASVPPMAGVGPRTGSTSLSQPQPVTAPFQVSCIRASRILHSDMLARIMKAPMAFFDVTPVGRIINRFSKDMDSVDHELPGNINDFIECSMAVVSSLIVICISTPYFLIAVFPLALIYIALQVSKDKEDSCKMIDLPLTIKILYLKYPYIMITIS